MQMRAIRIEKRHTAKIPASESCRDALHGCICIADLDPNVELWVAVPQASQNGCPPRVEINEMVVIEGPGQGQRPMWRSENELCGRGLVLIAKQDGWMVIRGLGRASNPRYTSAGERIYKDQIETLVFHHAHVGYEISLKRIELLSGPRADSACPVVSLSSCRYAVRTFGRPSHSAPSKKRPARFLPTRNMAVPSVAICSLA